ncbi:MAG: DUF1592 domain-containing protein [Planctomycetes bacterium]|nr:DUF1592 domain-containing protein [Planctomycetota bacterium]
MPTRARRQSPLLLAGTAAVVLGLASPSRAQDEVRGSAAQALATLRPQLERHCLECHSTAEQEGDLDLERFRTLGEVEAEARIWQHVEEQLEQGAMPPQDAAQPSAAERAAMLGNVRAMLRALARAQAADPGPIAVRRLTNLEYTLTLRELCGVPSLDPAREFPADGAAGEGFRNASEALAISPALLAKYLEAGKRVAGHAMLLPDGIRFAASSSRRDQVEELLAAIRALYGRFCDAGGGERVDLQGIVFATNGGGRIPLARYLAATLALRDARPDEASVGTMAAQHGLSPRYLATLLATLQAESDSPWLRPLREAWRRAGEAEVPALVAAIEARQAALFTFNTVGHLGKLGGPTRWLEPRSPIVERLAFDHALPATRRDGELELRLVARALVPSTHGSLRLRDARWLLPDGSEWPHASLLALTEGLGTARARRLAKAAVALPIAAALRSGAESRALEALAHEAGLPLEDLRAWSSCLGAGEPDPALRETLLTGELLRVGGVDAVAGFGSGDTPSIIANASDLELRVPGTLAPHSIAVHPSPSLRVGVAWRSPTRGPLTVTAQVQHAHPDCGNGVSWRLELRAGALVRTLATGSSRGPARSAAQTVEVAAIAPGDRLALVVAAIDGNHSCDLTALGLSIASPSDPTARWDLAADCADSILAGNPHRDAAGRADVWQFFTEPDREDPRRVHVAPTSALARWLAGEAPDAAALHDELAALASPFGPLLADLASAARAAPPAAAPLHFDAPGELVLRAPAALVAGARWRGTVEIDEGSPAAAVQVQVAVDQDAVPDFAPQSPCLAAADGPAREALEAALDEFRAVFPAALCYAQIVPVDEVITLTQFHREDDGLVRLMLEDAQARALDRLWDELRFVSEDALTQVDAFEQLWQYATQDADPSAFAPLREPIARRAAAFRETQLAARPRHVAALADFAARAWRRPLLEHEVASFAALHATLLAEGLAHDAAIRVLIARVLVAPDFLFRIETPGPGRDPVRVADPELAVRLSYFLWASPPDELLREAAARGALTTEAELLAQTRRMLADPRAQRFAAEFVGGWLQLTGFDPDCEKSETLFPGFAALRGAMFEETWRFFTDVMQRGGSVLELLDADHSFVNGALAAHYGIDGVRGEDWRRVSGLRALGRGGLLGQAATLAAHSGAGRTSPILRGNWIAEALLGERLPRPPKDVPQLPESELGLELSMREITARHRQDPRCAKCHDRIDAFGIALEGFDTIGRQRTHDLGGRAIDTRVTTPDGEDCDGLAGLRAYLLGPRRDEFVRQFARKLLGYALGRGLRLGDEVLLDALVEQMSATGHRIDRAIETIVTSPQFLMIRGRAHGDAR